uniref:PH domain-containing protein n=2 Tax=Dendroctonus ponderosae TaxID=77166 RepID=A0AAR5PF68_DENPD
MQYSAAVLYEPSITMTDTTLQNMEIYVKSEEAPKKSYDTQMTSSTISTISSLASPVDSGVQLLDSESELTSAMSNVSGCETDTASSTFTEDQKHIQQLQDEALAASRIKESETWTDLKAQCASGQNGQGCAKLAMEKMEKRAGKGIAIKQFTESDFVNKNVVDEKLLSRSVPNYFDKFSEKENMHKHGRLDSCKSLSDEVFEMEHPIKSNTEVDLMNISLNSYELLDYTLQNANLKTVADSDPVDMHISMSEEVNENLKVVLDGKEAPPPIIKEVPVIENPETKATEEQIVFRRQRKKKSKSDTPKKRVSFHEDILNSTKIDDIHINLGFITHEPDVSLSFFQRGFVRKPDVVKGRYSWAAEGDAPYYEKPGSNREIKSDIYIHHPRNSSSSSSSTGSASSSIDEEDSGSDENVQKKEPTQKQPKSSCLKKTKHKKYIDTKIVQEGVDFKKKKSESNLLDSNIFGSLKNILSFSTSVPLAERGVPEGQEDVVIYSSSQNLSSRRKSFENFSFANAETIEVAEVKPEPVSKVNLAKTNLKLTKSEGFYPNYPNQEIPENIILCDSNVYEHKGISYSYEYDNFQKNFEKQQKPKSSMMYQRILKEFNFFRRKAQEEAEVEVDDFEIINNQSTPTKPEVKIEEVFEVELPESDLKTCSTSRSTLSKYASSSKLDWSDNETVSDMSECRNSRHLDSPKRKARRSNHYTLSPFKVPLHDSSSEISLETSKSLPNLRPSSSKSSLLNRFLKNVTLKKLMDFKAEGNLKRTRSYIGLYPKSEKLKPASNCELDSAIEQELISGREKQKTTEPPDQLLTIRLRNQIFRNKLEQLLKIFPIRSAYTTNGDSKPLLLVLTNRAIYVVSSKQSTEFSTHFVLPYTDLNAILIGPNSQTVHFSNNDTDMQCILTTGCSKITNDLIGQIEIAMRRDANKPALPAVKHLSMRDMTNLRRAICKQTTVNKDEQYYYYSIVHIQDFVCEESPTPLGPSKEGPLMFKSTDRDSNRWETAYFILKAGVLYMLSSVSQRVPMRVFPLMNGACQGARRVFNSHRPHTFQLIVEGNSLLLAAPDEYVASEWLQELIHAASGIYNNYKDKNATQSCSLLMTSDHILTVREAFPCSINSLLPAKTRHEPIKGPQALSCAAITDLIAFRLPSAEQSWCVLEFSCREVHEYTGDWIIYFSTNSELETFISTLEMLWQYGNENGDSFPLSTIPETDPLSKKCIDTYRLLFDNWLPNTVHLQFM